MWAGELAQWAARGDRGLSYVGLTAVYTCNDQASVLTPTEPSLSSLSPHLSSSLADSDHLTWMSPSSSSRAQAGLDLHLLCAGTVDVLNHGSRLTFKYQVIGTS